MIAISNPTKPAYFFCVKLCDPNPSPLAVCVLHEYNFVDVQKLISQQVALQKSTSTSEKDKEKWKECLIEDLISSEDSDEDGSFLVRPLPR